MAIEAWQVPLWDAINRYVVACGGDPEKAVYGNTSRMKAVVDVNTAVRSASDNMRVNWDAVKNHVSTIAEAGARNDERQGVFVELRAIMDRLEAGWK